jgi:hypothetical protein
VKVSKDGTEEKSVLRVLDMVYAQPEDDAALEKAKQAAKGDIYAAQYLDFGRKYFGFGQDRAARRCMLRAFWCNPRRAWRENALRYWAASFVPRGWYDGAKAVVKGLVTAG